DHECINCGDCRKVCHCNAIEWKTLGKLIKEEEVEEIDNVIASDVDLNEAEAINTSNEEIKLVEAPKKKKVSKSKIIKWTSAILAVILLVFTLIYANVMNKTERFNYGNKVGDTCVDRSLGIIGSDEEFSVQNNNGKITIINFWYTSCTPCLKELPYFDQIQKAYPEDVTVIAVHEGSSYASNPAYVENFINKKYKDYTLTFVFDDYTDSNASLYYSELGGTGTWPMTVIVDQNGIISLVKYDAATYEQLEAEVERLLANNN
ncbi:MAG: redoxin family protein, partial [Acholeplasmatales bacterium]|nr:redoxin family protein [Acholeplasmatales bacterium]